MCRKRWRQSSATHVRPAPIFARRRRASCPVPSPSQRKTMTSGSRTPDTSGILRFSEVPKDQNVAEEAIENAIHHSVNACLAAIGNTGCIADSHECRDYSLNSEAPAPEPSDCAHGNVTSVSRLLRIVRKSCRRRSCQPEAKPAYAIKMRVSRANQATPAMETANRRP